MKSVYRSSQGKAIIMQRYEEILKLWPEPNEMYFIPTSFGNTFVICSGNENGDPVILLHGSTTNAAMWMNDAIVLGKKRRVFAIDIIGEPGKSDESRPDMKEGNYAKWLTELLDGLGLGAAAVVGNSLGGWMALDLATNSPERVSHLVLLASGGICPVNTSFMFKAIGLMMLGKKGASIMNSMLFGDVTIPKEAMEFGELLRKHYISRPFEAPIFSDDVLSQLTMPVLYMGGEKDVLFPSKKCAQRLTELLPNADTHVPRDIHHTLINKANDIAVFLDVDPKGTEND